MKRHHKTSHLATIAALAVGVSGSASAVTVWNVNIGSSTANGISPGDNYVGAAPENTANSTWNNVTSSNASVTLDDSTGSNGAGVTLAIVGDGIGNTNLTSGDRIFYGWTKSNNSPYTVTLGNLNSGNTYDLVVYSDWFWDGGNGEIALTQTLGTGLAGTAVVNHDPTSPRDSVGPLSQDTNPADVDGPFNWYRITGLTPDGSGDLGFSIGGANSPGSNAPFNGFQLIENDVLVAIPEPSTTALLGLSGLALVFRRRK